MSNAAALKRQSVPLKIAVRQSNSLRQLKRQSASWREWRSKTAGADNPPMSLSSGMWQIEARALRQWKPAARVAERVAALASKYRADQRNSYAIGRTPRGPRRKRR